MKEKVANAFSHDIQYAMQWVEIPDDATYDALAAECRYGMLENELNSALRESIKAVALRNKIQAETERMHTLGRRLMSRQILWLMYDHLRPHIAGDNIFKIIELTKMSIDRFTRGCEAERLEAFMDRWDHNLAGITQARPPDDMLCALLYEQVRGMKSLELDMHLWNRDETVRNYAFVRNSVATAVAYWRLRDNAERMYPATRSVSPRHAAPAPSPRRSSRSPRSHSPGRGRKKTHPRRNHSSSPKRRFSRDRNKAAPARHGSPKRKSASRSPTRSPGGRFMCKDYLAGRCNRGADCKFSHARNSGGSPNRRGGSMSPISMESGICFHYARGKCTRDKCPYKHEKPSAPAEPAAPAQSEGFARRTDSPAPTPGDFPEAASTFHRKSPLTCNYVSDFACPAPSVARSVHFGPVEVRCFPNFRVASAFHARLLARGIQAIRGLRKSGV